MRWRLVPVLLISFIASGAEATPCATVKADCTEWIEVAGEPSRVLVYRTYPLNIRNNAIGRALIMVHGQGRDADNYFRHAFGAGFFLCLSKIRSSSRHALLPIMGATAAILCLTKS